MSTKKGSRISKFLRGPGTGIKELDQFSVHRRYIGPELGESFETPEMPEPTEEQKALEARQREALTQLDVKENERRKRLLSAMQGIRAFRGSALFRASVGRAPSAGVSASSGGSGGYAGSGRMTSPRTGGSGGTVNVA